MGSSNTGQVLFIAGTIPLMAAGGLHALVSLLDAVRPRFFAPLRDPLQAQMDADGMRFRAMFPGAGEQPSIWRFWLGFNLSHGLGAFTFGAICLLIAVHEYSLVEQVAALRALTIAIPVAYLAISLTFWFYVPTLVVASATACFAVAAVL
jgi:hypothetical protein